MAPGGEATLLSNGHYAVLLTAAGGGYSALGRYALTRWAPDRTRDADGFFIYVRDVDSGAFWSAGHQPVGQRARRDEVTLTERGAQIARRDGDVETRLEVCVAPDEDAELRRLTLTNHGARTRRLEVTTCAEVVLNTPAADAAHPAFSKLFVQTGLLLEHQALLAWRRLRSPEDGPLWLVHLLSRVHAVVPRPGRRDALPDRRQAGRGEATSALVDGVPAVANDGAVLIPLARDGAAHRVEVALGTDVGPRYEASED